MDAMVENLQLVDCQEGLKAFLEKRPANWTHTTETVPVEQHTD